METSSITLNQSKMDLEGGGVLVVSGYREAGVVGEMKGIPDGSDSSVRRVQNTE